MHVSILAFAFVTINDSTLQDQSSDTKLWLHCGGIEPAFMGKMRVNLGSLIACVNLHGHIHICYQLVKFATQNLWERIRQFNDLAQFFGDERAQNARNIWNRPLKSVYISDCGELKVTKPSLTPSLP
ncbi:hypothetical protein JHK87_024500 [Glycine soja]|uniref:Uncharacterized protein n=1 Tax=Glycine max TaxID=3847 RepID=K7LCT4_SOYBN|nr:hypothetical protein JHK87_024500 [Glycine soja]